MTGHPDALDLSMYADGELSPERVAEVERHLATCADCRAEVAKTQAFSRQLRRLPDRPMPESFQLDAEALVAGRPQEPAAGAGAAGAAQAGGGRLLRPSWTRWAPHIYKVSAAAIVALVAWRVVCSGSPSLAVCTSMLSGTVEPTPGGPGTPIVATQAPPTIVLATSKPVEPIKTEGGGGGDDPRLTAAAATRTASIEGPTQAVATCPDDSNVTLSVSDAEGMTEAELLSALFSDYLRRHVDASVPASCRLDDFRIEGALDGNSAIRFSVLPYDRDGSDWWAGNGETGDGGWIAGKILFVKVERSGEDYAMQILGTMP